MRNLINQSTKKEIKDRVKKGRNKDIIKCPTSYTHSTRFKNTFTDSLDHKQDGEQSQEIKRMYLTNPTPGATLALPSSQNSFYLKPSLVVANHFVRYYLNQLPIFQQTYNHLPLSGDLWFEAAAGFRGKLRRGSCWQGSSREEVSKNAWIRVVEQQSHPYYFMSETNKTTRKGPLLMPGDCEVRSQPPSVSLHLMDKNLFRGKILKHRGSLKKPPSQLAADPAESQSLNQPQRAERKPVCTKVAPSFLKGFKQRVLSRLDSCDEASFEHARNLHLKCSSVFSRRFERAEQMRSLREEARSEVLEKSVADSKQPNLEAQRVVKRMKDLSSIDVSAKQKPPTCSRKESRTIDPEPRSNTQVVSRSKHTPTAPAQLSPSKNKTADTTDSEKKTWQRPLLPHDQEELRNIRAESYCVIEMGTGELVLSLRSNKALEIASLTKIMTAFLVLRVCRERDIDPAAEKFEVQGYVEDITGTSAEMIHGDIFTVEQLLYGLMLPSGNDAALVLADWAGSRLGSDTKRSHWRENVSRFVSEMTKYGRRLGLADTRYGNPHGLPHADARSTAIDQCRLTALCLRDPLFSRICRTPRHKFTIVNSDNRTREVDWENTNKLLRREGFVGVKTGITVTAGPCLVSAYEFRDKTYITAVLRSTKVSRRFKDSRKIVHWVLCKLYGGSTCFEETLRLEHLSRNDKYLDSDYSEDENEFKYGEEGARELSKRNRILREEL